MKLSTLAVSFFCAPIAVYATASDSWKRSDQPLVSPSKTNSAGPHSGDMKDLRVALSHSMKWFIVLFACLLTIGSALAQTSTSSTHSPATAGTVGHGVPMSASHSLPTPDVTRPFIPYRASCVLSTDPFARNQCSLSRGRHGQWVRGSATLLWDDHLNIQLGLETDSTFFGIGGHLEFDLLDAQGRVLYHGSTGEATIPGKRPGKARIWLGVWTLASVPHDVALKTQSIRVSTFVQDDNAPEPWGLTAWSAKITMNMPGG